MLQKVSRIYIHYNIKGVSNLVIGRKKVLTITVAVSLIALIIAGTFAWTNFSAHIINEFRGIGAGGDTENEPGGTLHNNHEDSNKDVFIENWGNEDLFVRIRLSEYMELGEGAGLHSEENDPDTGLPIPHPQNEAVSLVNNATIDNVTTWNVHKPLEDDPTICIDDPGFHEYWSWNMGGSKYFFPAPQNQRTDPAFIATDSGFDLTADSVNDEGVSAQPTRDALVVTMQQWVDDGMEIGDYWVLDTDGWAYWAAPLASGQATGLLLNGVTQVIQPEKDYFYGVFVEAQMATKDGTIDSSGLKDNYERFGDQSNGGWTAGGEALMAKIVASVQSDNNFVYSVHRGCPSHAIPASERQIVLSSYDEFVNYFSRLWNHPILNEYSENFFRNKSLAVEFVGTSMSNRVSILGLNVQNSDTIVVEYLITQFLLSPPDMAGHFIIVEVDKSITNIESIFTVVSRQMFDYSVFTGHPDSGSNISESDRHIVLSSYDEFVNYFNHFGNHEILNRYSEDFFQNKSLAIAYVAGVSGNTTADVSLISVNNGNTLSVSYRLNIPPYPTPDEPGLFIVVEVTKNVTSIVSVLLG